MHGRWTVRGMYPQLDYLPVARAETEHDSFILRRHCAVELESCSQTLAGKELTDTLPQIILRVQYCSHHRLCSVDYTHRKPRLLYKSVRPLRFIFANPLQSLFLNNYNNSLTNTSFPYYHEAHRRTRARRRRVLRRARSEDTRMRQVLRDHGAPGEWL